jgi:plasmid stabilization system protein ParE
MKVVWSKESLDSLSKIYNYIFSSSPQNALFVFEELLNLGDSLADERFEYSKELLIDSSKYRYIPKWSYKIIYERKLNMVVIIDVFNTKQNPNKLLKK